LVVFERIARDPEKACKANPIPGFNRRIWKYRCPSSDLGGSSGAFRIIACYEPEARTVYPILIYSKREQSAVSNEEVNEAMGELRRNIEAEDSEL